MLSALLLFRALIAAFVRCEVHSPCCIALTVNKDIQKLWKMVLSQTIFDVQLDAVLSLLKFLLTRKLCTTIAAPCVSVPVSYEFPVSIAEETWTETGKNGLMCFDQTAECSRMCAPCSVAVVAPSGCLGTASVAASRNGSAVITSELRAKQLVGGGRPTLQHVKRQAQAPLNRSTFAAYHSLYDSCVPVIWTCVLQKEPRLGSCVLTEITPTEIQNTGRHMVTNGDVLTVVENQTLRVGLSYT